MFLFVVVVFFGVGVGVGFAMTWPPLPCGVAREATPPDIGTIISAKAPLKRIKANSRVVQRSCDLGILHLVNQPLLTRGLLTLATETHLSRSESPCSRNHNCR